MIQSCQHKGKGFLNFVLKINMRFHFPYVIACKMIIGIILTSNSTICFAQKTRENRTPLIRGQILNIEDKSPVAGAIVTNQRTKVSVSADSEGRFAINAFLSDSLETGSLGFHKETVSIPAIYSISDILTIYAKPYSFLLPEINISIKKEQLKIDAKNRIVSPYFRNDMMKEKPISEKIYDNQISFLKIPFSTKKSTNPKIREAEGSESEWNSISRFYNKETIIKLTGLNSTEADNLMMYINSKKLFERMTTKENATYTILEQFKIYKTEKH